MLQSDFLFSPRKPIVEENVWMLCRYVRENRPLELEKCFVIFISNKDKQIPLWYQKASKRPDRLVIWDYHVVLLYQQGESSLLFDLDTELPFPCQFCKYLSKAIGDDQNLKAEFRRLFRVVRGEEYVRTFASDRSHMMKEDGSWLASPPPYPCISTPDSTNNLSDFISMDQSVGVGTVLTAQQLTQRFL